jgi:hypothetical protein
VCAGKKIAAPKKIYFLRQVLCLQNVPFDNMYVNRVDCVLKTIVVYIKRTEIYVVRKRDRCYDFFIFAEKYSENISIFYSNYFLQKFHRNIGI